MNGDQYYVLWPDGQKFGPADVSTLQRWAVENRIGPATLLESAANGHHIRAADHPDLRSVLPVPYSGPAAGPGPSVYGNPGFNPPPGGFIPSNPAAGTAEVTTAWVLGALGLFCCGTYAAVGGIICGVIAHSKRQPNAMAAIIFNIVVLVLSVVIGGLAGHFINFNL